MFRPPQVDEVLWEVEREHLDEAEFLLEVLGRALDAPHYRLDEVAKGPERRLLAHIDGLVVGGPVVARDLLAATCADPEADPATVAAAALAIAATRDRNAIEELLASLDGRPVAEASFFARALAACPSDELDARLVDRLPRSGDRGAAILLETLERRGVDPQRDLANRLRSADPEVVRSGVAAARHADPRAHLGVVEMLLGSADAAIAAAAIDVGLIFGSLRAHEAAVRAFAQGVPSAMVLLALVGEGGHHAQLERMVGDAARAASALWAMGFTGRAAAAQACLSQMNDDALAPLAAEAFVGITGAAGPGLWAEAPPVDEDAEAAAALPPIEEDPLDADLAADALAALPKPDPAAMAAWWREHGGGFRADERYIYGLPMNNASLAKAMGTASMRRRHVHALELAIRTRGKVVVPTRAFSGRQRSRSSGLDAWAPIDFRRSFARIS